MAWYVLFVKTGYEQKTVKQIEDIRLWSISDLHPFAPMYDIHFKKHGNIRSEKKVLFPGYVFIESELLGLDFALKIRPYILRSEYAMKLLRYGRGYESHSFEMRFEEYEELAALYNAERCVKMSSGFIVNDLVRVTRGPLVGLENRIVKIDRHKMQATIQLYMMGRLHDVKVGLEIIEKVIE